MSRSRDARKNSPQSQTLPFLELRIGGLHLTLRQAPYRLLTLVAAAAASAATWMVR